MCRQRTTLDLKLGYPLDHYYKFKKSKCPSIEPSGTAWISIQEERCPFKTTSCFVLLKKSFMRRKNFPDIPFCSNLKMRPSY